MFAKLCAAWLVVLVLLPFTAPFSTFDLTDLLPGQSDGLAGASSSNLPTTAITRAALSHAVPFPLRAGRLRLVMARLRLSSGAAIAHHSEGPSFQTWAIHTIHPSSRPTVLRI